MSTMDRAQWLEERRKGIGGSDAAAIIGLNNYVTPYMLWADKTGRLPEKEDNEAMRQGRDLEGYVAQRFTESAGKRVHIHSGIIRNPTYPFAHANIDRKVSGERAGLECKTTSVLNLKKFKNGEFPEHYYVQCIHYLAVTGYDRWYLAVLILNQGFRWFTIERDEEEIHALMKAEQEFWDTYVIPDIPPPVDGLSPTSRALQEVYRLPDSDSEAKPLYQSDILNDYQDLKRQIAMLETQKKKCEQILQQELGNSISGICGGIHIDWKPVEKRTFDLKKFASEHPDINLNRYFKQSQYRRFVVKEKES